MAYFKPYIDTEGVHVPTYSDIIEYLQSQYKTIFGEDAYIGEETPDYQMMSIFARCMEDFTALAIDCYNNRDPEYASGDALDTLVQFIGMIRRPSTATETTLTVGGEPGTIIPEGSKAIDQNGYIWDLNNEVEIPSNGIATVGAECETLGAIVAPIGTINGIYTPILGWLTVTNTQLADSGTDTESDAALRLRFMEAHAVTNSGTADSIIAGLLNVDGVTYVSLAHNDGDSTDSRGLPGHSFCAVVEGGEDRDVAEKVFYMKPPGVRTYGNIDPPIEITDSFGYVNEIYFSRPEQTVIEITITIRTFDNYDADRVNSIMKDSLKNDINTLGIGKSWNVSMGYKDIYSAFQSNDISFSIKDITANPVGGSDVGDVFPCAYDETLHTEDSKITIVVDND